MTADEGYNGWKNYETWSVALVVDNDQELHAERRGVVRGAATAARIEFDATAEADRVADVEQYERWKVAEALHEWVDSEIGDLMDALPKEYGDWRFMVSQLFNAGLSAVDWDEIARNWLSDLAEEVA